MTQIRQYTSQWFGDFTYSIKEGVDISATTLNLNNRQTFCNLMIFEGLSHQKMQTALVLLDQLERFDDIARQTFKQQSKEPKSLVHSFIKEHFEDYGEETETEIAKKIGTEKHNFQKFIDHLELGAMSLSEDAREDVGVMLTLDYSLIWQENNGFNTSFTDQLLVARFDQQGEFLGLAHES